MGDSASTDDATRHDGNALSQALRALLDGLGETPITCGELAMRLGARSHEMLLIFFAFPLCMPVPIPALSTIFGLAATFVAYYFAMGKPPWLPARIANRPIRTDSLRRACGLLMRLLGFTEHVIHPRWLVISESPRRVRLHGVMLFLLAFLVALPLPVPLANTFGATPMLLLALGLLERDGVCIALGYLATIPCFLYYGAIVFLGFEGMRQFMAWLL